MQFILKALGYLLTAVVAPAVQAIGLRHHLDPDTAAAISIAVAGAGARMLHVATPPVHAGPPNYLDGPPPGLPAHP